jgi:AraC family transcriptional regulator, activator of mtrCDE
VWVRPATDQEATVIDQVLEDLALDVEPFAMCVVSSGWRLRMPQSDGATLHFVLRGSGQLRLPGGPDLPLAPYSLAVVPDHRGHALQVPPIPVREVGTGPARVDGLVEHVAGIEGDRELLVACGRVRVLYGGAFPLFSLLDRPLVVDFSDAPPMRALFERLIEESGQRMLGHASMLRALMSECLVALLRRLHQERDDDLAWLHVVEDPRIAAAIAAVLDRPGGAHTVDSLARAAHLSRSAFAERFTTVIGRTPIAFVREVRMQRAAELLRTTRLDVATVAHRVGFSSRSHFSRSFRESFGVPPSAHRAAQRPTAA